MPDFWLERYKITHRVEGLGNGLLKEMAKTLEESIPKINAKITAIEMSKKKLTTIAREKLYQEQLKAEINKVLKKTYEELGDTVKAQSIELAREAPDITNTIMNKSLGKINFGVPTITMKQATAWFESTLIEGTAFNDWMSKLSENLSSRIVQEVRQSMVLKESAKETTQRLIKAVDASKHGANAISRTALHQAYSHGEFKYFEKNEKRTSYYRFIAEMDHKTTPLCSSLHLKEFDNLDDVPVPPLHMRCRSHVHAIPKGFEDIRGRQVSRIGNEVEFLDPKTSHHDMIQSWVDSKDPNKHKFAMEALGKTRFDLVKKGKLKVEKLYYHGELRTVKELKGLL